MIGHRKFGIALSGGGFRAAAFHLGTLRGLKKLGVLGKVDVISTISGGSILGAAFALNEDFEKFEEKVHKLLQSNLLYRIFFSLEFSFKVFLLILPSILLIVFQIHWAIVALVVVCTIMFVLFYLYKIFPTTEMIQKQYSNALFSWKKVSELPVAPLLVINSTNLETGTLMTFTKSKIYDSSYSYQGDTKSELNPEKVTIAKAVSASTAFPYFFHPVTFSKTEFVNVEDYDKVKPCLADGGLFDNQGIYRLVSPSSANKCDVVIVSDAAAPFKKKIFTTNPLPILRRIMDILMKRIRNVQFINSIYQSDEKDIFEIGYFSLDWQYSKCVDGFIDAINHKKLREHLFVLHNINKEVSLKSSELRAYIKQKIDYERIVKTGLTIKEIEELTMIKTSLNSLSINQIKNLIRHAETLCELQVRLYCPALIKL